MKNTRAIAISLGRLGGQARAKRLAPADRQRIAALGGAAKRTSFEVARRITDNLAYLAAMEALGGSRRTTRISRCKGPLPGLYPERT